MCVILLCPIWRRVKFLKYDYYNFHRTFRFKIFHKFLQNFEIRVNFFKIFESFFLKLFPKGREKLTPYFLKISVPKFSWHLLVKLQNTYFQNAGKTSSSIFLKLSVLKILRNLLKISAKIPDHYLLKLFPKFLGKFSSKILSELTFS